MKVKVHILHIIWELKNTKNATETAKIIYCVYDQRIITDHQPETGFQSFVLAINYWQMKADQEKSI